MSDKGTSTPGMSWAVPEELGIPPDKLRLRLDFFHQATTLTYFEGEKVTTKIVDAIDIAHALASDLSFSTGLLPEGVLWWQNTRDGPVFAMYAQPQVWKVALQVDAGKPAKRYNLPLPGLIFLCTPGQAPWVYAVKKKPTKETDIVYKAPLTNIYNNGRSCPGSHTYPNRVADTIKSFFLSFFSIAGDRDGRSKKFPGSVVKLWDFINGKGKFPLDDLIPHATVKDLMTQKMEDGRRFAGPVEDEEEDNE